MLTITATDVINTVDITNIAGQVVYQVAGTAGSVQVDISGFAPGIYFVKVNGNVVRKFVKE